MAFMGFAGLAGCLLGGVALLGEVSTPPPEPGQPAVELQAVLERDALNRGETINAFLLLTNKSDTTLTQVKLEAHGVGLDVTIPSLNDVAPYSSVRVDTGVKAQDSISFGQHRVLYLLEYKWANAKKSGVSTQAV